MNRRIARMNPRDTLLFIAGCMLFILVIVCICMAIQIDKEKMKNEACMNLLTFNVKQLSYALEVMNISVEEFSDNFIRNEVEVMLAK